MVLPSDATDKSDIQNLCATLLSKIEKINFTDAATIEGFSEDEVETLLVGAGMAEAYMAEAISINAKGVETLQKADELAMVCILQGGSQ